MKKILVATEKPFAPQAIKKMKEVITDGGFEFVLLEAYSGKEELAGALQKASGLIVRSDIIDGPLLEAANSLEIAVRAGSGYDNIDCKTATVKGVVVMNTPGQNANAVAELALGLMIYAIRNFYTGKTGSELQGKTLGLHGFGNISRKLFYIAKALGMDVIVYTEYSKKQASEISLENASSLEDLYKRSDVVSVHVPAKGGHIESVNYEILKHLKEDAIVVNTARKEVIAEEDLIRFMDERKDVKYVSDIAPAKHTEFEGKFSGRYFSTPKKMGAQTKEANMNAGVAAAEQVVSYLKNGNTTFRVN